MLSNYKNRKEPDRIILVKPNYYNVVDVKNPYMKGEAINHQLAQKQWQDLVNIYQSFVEKGILKEVVTLDAVEDLEDMVYCANQSLPYQNSEGKNNVILSNMLHDSRKREVPYFKVFYESRNYQTHFIDKDVLLEGMGDSIFHPFTQLLWMGYGYRTALDTAEILANKLGIEVIPLKLVSPYFYHLDTCFLPADENTVFLCKEAFDDASFLKIQAVFKNIIEVPREEAIATFELNTHCIYNKNQSVALSPTGNHTVKNGLLKLGYQVFEVDTSEFIKGGGSVFCMKMMFH